MPACVIVNVDVFDEAAGLAYAIVAQSFFTVVGDSGVRLK